MGNRTWNAAGSHYADKCNCRKVVMLKVYYATVEINDNHALAKCAASCSAYTDLGIVVYIHQLREVHLTLQALGLYGRYKEWHET
jgi:hypothetical protein